MFDSSVFTPESLEGVITLYEVGGTFTALSRHGKKKLKAIIETAELIDCCPSRLSSSVLIEVLHVDKDVDEPGAEDDAVVPNTFKKPKYISSLSSKEMDILDGRPLSLLRLPPSTLPCFSL